MGRATDPARATMDGSLVMTFSLLRAEVIGEKRATRPFCPRASGEAWARDRRAARQRNQASRYVKQPVRRSRARTDKRS